MSENMLDEDDFEFAQTLLLLLARQVLLMPVPELLKTIEGAKSNHNTQQPQELILDLGNLEVIAHACNDFRNTLLNLTEKIDS